MATIPMFDPQGDVRMVPRENVEAASKSGGRLAYKMFDPKGQVRWVPKEHVSTALAQQGNFYSQQESQRFDPNRSYFEMHPGSSTTARGTWKAMQGVVTEGLVGHKLHEWFPETTEKLGIAPTENPLAAGQGEHRQQLLVPESLMESDPRHAKAEPMSVGERFTRGVLKAGGGLTTPGNIAMMAIPIGGFAGLFGKGAEALVPRLVSGGFSAQMLYSLYQQWPQFKEAMDRGDYGAASEMAGEGAVTLATAFMATKHAAFGEGGAVPRDKVAAVLKQAEKEAQLKGFVGMRRPEGPQVKIDTEIRPGAVEEFRRQQAEARGAQRKQTGGEAQQLASQRRGENAGRLARQRELSARAEETARERQAREEEERFEADAKEAEAKAAALRERQQQAQAARLERRKAKAAARPGITEPPKTTEGPRPGETAFGAALRQAVGAPQQPRQPGPQFEPGIEAVGEQVGAAAEQAGPPDPERLVQGFAESRMMSREELARDIRSRHKSRVSDDERWWLYQHMKLNGEPLPAKAPPVPKTEFGQKLQRALNQPVKPQPAAAEAPTPPRVEAVARGVQRAAETSRPPTLERQVWEFAEQNNMDPASLAKDIGRKHPTQRTPEEKRWLQQFRQWAGSTGLDETPEPTPPPRGPTPEPKGPTPPAPAETKEPTPETEPAEAETPGARNLKEAGPDVGSQEEPVNLGNLDAFRRNGLWYVRDSSKPNAKFELDGGANVPRLNVALQKGELKPKPAAEAKTEAGEGEPSATAEESGREGGREEPEQPAAEPTTPPPAPKVEEPPTPEAPKPVTLPEPTGPAGELDKAKNKLAAAINMWQQVPQNRRMERKRAQARVDAARADVDKAQAAVDAAPKPKPVEGRSRTLGSREEPLYWPEKDRDVYFKDGSWWVADPGTGEWTKATSDQNNDLVYALKSKGLQTGRPARELTPEQKARIRAQTRKAHGLDDVPEPDEPTPEPQAAAAEPEPTGASGDDFRRRIAAASTMEDIEQLRTQYLISKPLPMPTQEWVKLVGDAKTRIQHAAKRPGPAKFEPVPTPTGEPAPAQAAAVPENKLEAARKEYDALRQKKEDLTADEIKRMNELERQIQELDTTKAVPLVTVQSDPRDKNKTHLDYYTKALDTVKQAWVRHNKRTNPDVKHSDSDWWDIMSERGIGQKPPEYPGNYIRIEVPGDGKFKIVNNPKNLEAIMKGAKGAFKKPGKVPEPSSSVPRAPKDFDVDAYLAQLDAERAELQDELKSAEGDRKERLEEELRANEENRRVALGGEEAPQAEPVAATPERTFTPPKSTPVTPARDKNEVHADYNAGVADYQKTTPKDAQRDYDAVLTGVAAALDKSNLEPDPANVVKGKESARSPWYWELNNLWHNPLASEKPNQSLAAIVKKLEATLPTMARKVETDRKDWVFTSPKGGAEKMRQSLEDGDYGKELAQATKFAAEQRRKAQILETLGGETPKTRAARKAADETDLQVAQKRHWAEGKIDEAAKLEATEAAEVARRPITRAERMRPLKSLKVKPREAWTPEQGKVYKMDEEGKTVSDGRVVVRRDKPTVEGKKADKWRAVFEAVVPDKKTVKTFEDSLPADRQPLTFLGYQDEGGDIGDIGYFLKPDNSMIGVDPHRMGLFRELFGEDVTFEGAKPDQPIVVLKDGDPVGMIAPIQITEDHIDLPTAKRTLAIRGKEMQRDVGLGARARRREQRESLEAPPRPPSQAQGRLFDESAVEPRTAWDKAAREPYRNMPTRPRGPAPAQPPPGAQRQQAAAPEPPVSDEELRAYTGPGVPDRGNPLHEKVKDFRQTISDVNRQVRSKIALATLDPDARQMALHERTRLSTLANEEAKFHAALSKARPALNKLGPQGRVAFLLAAEGGKKFENPELQGFADTWREIQEKLWRQVQQKAGIRKFVENYWAHYWQDPEAGQKFGQDWIAKRTLEGRKEYLKKRSYPTIQEGLDAGLKLATDDPIEMQMRKIRSMLQFITGDDVIESMKDLGTSKFSFGSAGRTANIPPDWKELPRPWGKVFGPKSTTIREAMDKNLFQQLNNFARSLGILHMREQPMSDGTLGWYDPATGEVVTKIATPLGTLTHEIGHALDFQYGPPGQSIWETMQKIPGERGRRIRRELKTLADMRFAGAEDKTSANYKKYVRKGTEKMANMFDAFVNMPWLFDENHPDAVAPNVGQWLKGYLASNPKLRPLLDIKPSLVRSALDHTLPTGEMEHKGTWYAPPSAVEILERSMSAGLSENPLFKTTRFFSNSMVAARLSFSGRHMLFTAFEPMASHLARGIKQATQGRWKEAGWSLLKSSPYAITNTLMKGHRAFKDFYGAGVDGIENEQIFKDITAAGGRFQQDPWYTTRGMEKLRARWQEGKPFSAIGLHGMGAAVDFFAYPTMKWWVPRMKLGIFMENAGEEMRNNPFTVNDVFRYGNHYFDGLKPEARAYAEEVANAIHAGSEPERPEDMDERMAERIEQRVSEVYQHSRQMKKRETLQNVWDSVDNRLGQIVYDNLFWDRGLKELGQSGVQSLGWNLGFFKEFGGGAIDLAKWATRKKPLSMKAAYTIAYPITLGMMGLIYQFVKTGRTPKTTKDWRTDPFFPHNGDGDERVNLPSYINDFYRYGRGYQYGVGEGLRESSKEVMAKTSPVFSTLNEMLQNRDFYGTQVYNPEDPLFKQALAAAKHAAGAYLPYSTTNISRLTEATGKPIGPAEIAESVFGINKAPSSLGETRMEHLMREYAGNVRLAGAVPQAERERLTERKQLAERLKHGDTAVNEQIQKDIAARKLKPSDWEAIHNMSRTPWWANTAKRLTLEQMLHAWDEASPEEKKILAPILRTKGGQLPPDRNDPIWDRWRKALADQSYMTGVVPIATPMTSLQPPPAP